MRNMLLIARREYLEQVRGRAFKMTTFGVPAIFAVVIGVGYLSNLGLGSGRHLAVAANDPVLANEIKSQLLGDKDAKAKVDIVSPASSADRDALVSEVRNKTIDGFLWVETPSGQAPTATYTSQSAGDFITGGRLHDAVNHAILDAKLTAGGMPHNAADKLVDGVHLQTFQVKKDGSVVKSNAAASFWKGYVMAILLSMTTMIYGMNVARSIIQEKTSRIFEVMLAITRPATCWQANSSVSAPWGSRKSLSGWSLARSSLVRRSPPPYFPANMRCTSPSTEAMLFPVYFVLGYLLYSSLFAGLAASCETEQELQMYMPLAAAPTWLSFSLIVLVMNDSNSLWSVAGSLFPPTAPIIMFLRMASQIPPVWQFAVSIALLVLSIWLVLWISASSTASAS